MLLAGYKKAFIISTAKEALDEFKGVNRRYIDINTALEIVANDGVTIFDNPLSITNLNGCYKILNETANNANESGKKKMLITLELVKVIRLIFIS